VRTVLYFVDTTSSVSQFCIDILKIGKAGSGLGLDYRQIFIGAMDVVSILFMVSVFSMKSALVHRTNDKFSEYSHGLYEWGFRGILLEQIGTRMAYHSFTFPVDSSITKN